MWKIDENLFLAQLPLIEGPTRLQEFKKNKIRRVLSVTTEPIAENLKVDGVLYKFIETFDMPNQAILEDGFLADAIEFVNESVENEENVVVHCIAAVSRSVTVCVAYEMFKNQWSLEKALKMVRSIRKSAEPNPGFLAQLKIWERCGLDLSRDRYKNLKVEDEVWRQPVLENPGKTRFKCRSCRKLLFNSDNIVHDENCQKYLIEPMDWLKLNTQSCSIAHSCGAKLGNFVGGGQRCNGCNKFVRQWIFIDKSKIDKIDA